MERFIIEAKAPDTTPIDWYHVGVRNTEEKAQEAVDWYNSRTRLGEGVYRYRKVTL